jgi:hypothetical protein
MTVADMSLKTNNLDNVQTYKGGKWSGETIKNT